MNTKHFFFFLFAITPTLSATALPQPDTFQNPQTWGDERLKKILATEKIKSMTPMRDYLKHRGKKSDFNGNVHFVTLANGVKAVFKAYDAEEFAKEGFAGIAAYRAACWLGFPHIPPIVARTIGKQQGTLQLFVESEIDLLAKGALLEAAKKVPPLELAQLQLFYFIFGQWDTCSGNMIFVQRKKKYHLIAIDNDNICELQQVHYGCLPFVALDNSFLPNKTQHYKPSSFPFGSAQTLQFDKVSDQLLVKSFISRWLFQRLVRTKKKIRCIIHQNRVWRQYLASSRPWESYLPAYTRCCPVATLNRLQQLDRSVLKNIFANAKKAPWLTSEYCDLILHRRDQVVKAFTDPRCTKTIFEGQACIHLDTAHQLPQLRIKLLDD